MHITSRYTFYSGEDNLENIFSAVSKQNLSTSHFLSFQDLKKIQLIVKSSWGSDMSSNISFFIQENQVVWQKNPVHAWMPEGLDSISKTRTLQIYLRGR